MNVIIDSSEPLWQLTSPESEKFCFSSHHKVTSEAVGLFKSSRASLQCSRGS